MRQVQDDVWVIDELSHTMFGIHLGTRATIVRLPTGGLWVHSPVPLSEVRKAAVDELGPVEHILGPNLYHHVYLREWMAAYPDATMHGVPGLAKKRSDVEFDQEIGDGSTWDDVFTPLSMPSMLGETVFVHRPSATLVCCDLVENFTKCDHWPTRMYLKVSGIHEKPGLSRLLRPMFRDRPAFREQLDQLLDMDFERIVLAHGDLIESRPKEILRETYHWL